MRILYGILLSLAIHYILVQGMELAALYFGTQPKQTTEIVLVEAPISKKSEKSLNRQIVREALAPEIERKENDENLARFLSASRQRVKKESQAALSGKTKNSSPQAKMIPQIKYDSDNIITKTLQSNPHGFNSSPATIGEAIPQDVSIGNFTALNTDSYTHYSFFARVEDLIRFRWESRVRQAIDSFNSSYVLGVVGNKVWVTTVDIWLTPEGHFHSSHIMKESGIKRFDLAVTMAFREAAMFSNPPKEFLEDDGFIHLKYSFNVNFRPSALVYQQ